MEHKPDTRSILKLIAKIIGGIVVLFIVAVALVFGVCLFGSGN